MSNLQFTVAEINKLKPVEIIEHPIVHDKFVSIYESLHGAGGEGVYQRESTYFKQAMRGSDKLLKAEPFSIFSAVIELAVCGLSLAPGSQSLCYIESRGYKTGAKDPSGRDIYGQRAALVVSGYGELVLRQKAGQILHADNPVLVYEEDEFSFTDKNGRKTVDYTCRIPHISGHIIACYMHITRTDGTDDYAVMLEEDWMRLKDYSEKNGTRRFWNKEANRWEEVKSANELYTSANGSIDPGFLKAKCIKHAFKTYPKVKLGIGRNTLMETDIEEQQPDYVSSIVPDAPTYEEQQPQQQSFAEPKDTSAGVVVTLNGDEPF